MKCIRALRWQHYLNIPEVTLNKAAETLTSSHLQYKEARGLHAPERSEHLRQLSCTHSSCGRLGFNVYKSFNYLQLF